MRIADLMSRDVVATSPESSLKEMAALLADHHISGVPVIDEAGVVVGVISEADVLQIQSRTPTRGGLLSRLIDNPTDIVKWDATSVGEAMTTPVVTITQEQDVREAARIMMDEGVNRLPVLDDAGVLVGVVTRADIVRAFLRSDDEILREIEDDVLPRILWIDPQTVDVAVHDGHVTVVGHVESNADAELIDAFVSRLTGVVHVDNQLEWDVDHPRVPAGNPRVPRPPRDH